MPSERVTREPKKLRPDQYMSPSLSKKILEEVKSITPVIEKLRAMQRKELTPEFYEGKFLEFAQRLSEKVNKKKDHSETKILRGDLEAMSRILGRMHGHPKRELFQRVIYALGFEHHIPVPNPPEATLEE